MAPRLIPQMLVAALLTLGLASSPVHAKSPTPEPVETAAAPTKVLVLGDSYSAGNGAGDYYGSPTLQTECRRSRDDYGNLYGALETAAGHPTDVTVDACSGAVTDSYWHAQHADLEPQQAYVNKSYDLVMLTLGGNDASFSGLAQNCLMAGPGLNATDPARCDASLTNAEGMVPTIGDRLTKVLADIEERLAPNAKVVLVGYPYLESDTGLMVGDTAAGARLRQLQVDADAMEAGVVDGLNAQAANKPFVFVKTSPLFAGQESWLPAADQVNHELSSASDAAGSPNAARWMTAPFIDAGLADSDTFYHPNAAGWAGEAQLLLHSAAVPDAFGSGTGWTRVVVAKDKACGVRSGTTWCWGGGHSDPRHAKSLPKVLHLRAHASGHWHSLSTNGRTTCGIKADGTGWCWGDNAYGQLGTGATLGSHRGVAHPVKVSGGHRWKRIVVGAHQACGILRGGRLACWGADRKGALGRAVTTGEHQGAVTAPAEIRMPAYS